jgi:hypothetical protein
LNAGAELEPGDLGTGGFEHGLWEYCRHRFNFVSTFLARFLSSVMENTAMAEMCGKPHQATTLDPAIRPWRKLLCPENFGDMETSRQPERAIGETGGGFER